VNSISCEVPNSRERQASDPLAANRKKVRTGWIIAAASFAFVVIQLDVTIVNVALARISEDMHAPMAALQWVVDAYTLGFATFLLSAGAAGDRFGSKRVFMAGFVGFSIASLACGLAPNILFLNAARAIQGVGAAVLVPSSLAVLNSACADDHRLRARAVGIWTAAGGVAIAAGPVVGGLLLTGYGWRSIFLVNLPVCALGLALAYRFVPESPLVRKLSPFDLSGQVLMIAALTALIGAVIEVRPLGMTHPVVLGGILLAITAGSIFVVVEARTANPVLPLSLFQSPGFAPATFFGVLVNFSYYGVIFVLSLFLQKVLGYSASRAGFAFIPLTATFIVSNMASGWMTGRTGPRTPMVLGGLMGAFGYALLSQLGPGTTFLEMLPGFVLIPLGIGLAVPAMTTTILSGADQTRSGTVSALLNAARQTGGALGVAAFGALINGEASGQILSGIAIVAWAAAALSTAAALLALRIPRYGATKGDDVRTT
jgi:MFS transporter, DHA2 family, methylenomycin A resistance protein